VSFLAQADSPDATRTLSERQFVDFLAQIELTMDCHRASIFLSMEIAPAALPKRIARVIVHSCGLFWGIVGCVAEYLLRRFGGKLQEQTRIDVLHRWSRRTLPHMGIRVEVTDCKQASRKMHKEVEHLRFSRVEVAQ
jgi:hypothetical protein